MTESRWQRARAALRCVSLIVPTAFAFATLTPTTASAQIPNFNSIEPAVRFVNQTPFARHEWGTATVPFAQGQYRPGDTFETPGIPSYVTPFGARWPDGSIRYGRLTARVPLAPFQNRVLQVRRTSNPQNLQFTLGPWVAANFGRFDFRLVVGLPGGRTETAPLRFDHTVDVTPTEQTHLYRARVPNTAFVYDLWVTFFSGQDHARFELRTTNSSTTDQNWSAQIERLGFVVDGAIPFVRHSTYHGIFTTPPTAYGENGVSLISNPTHFYDGQAMEWYGTFAFVNPAIVPADTSERLGSLFATLGQELYGVATNWPQSNAFGPFGTVPEPPPWFVDGGVSASDGERLEFEQFVAQRGSMWEDRLLGLLPYGPAPGDQYDFGTTNLGDIVRTTLPDRIAEARFGVGEEAMRPVHYREANGEMVRSANHPDWVAWSGRTHFDNRTSPDRLGKPFPEPWLSLNAHGWTGKDNQHWSSNALAVTYLLTTSHSLRMEIDTEIELYLAGHRIAGQSSSPTVSIGPARALGRTMLSMSWHYLATGRTELRERLRARAEANALQQYRGLTSIGAVRPIRVSNPDPRATVTGDFWSPWGEGIAAMGLEANARVTGSIIAHSLAVVCANSLTWNGWKLDPNDFRIGYTISYKPGGIPLTPAEQNDPNYVDWASSTGLRDWCSTAARISLAHAQSINDTATIQQATQVLNLLEQQRAPQRTGRWDRFANWESF